MLVRSYGRPKSRETLAHLPINLVLPKVIFQAEPSHKKCRSASAYPVHFNY